MAILLDASSTPPKGVASPSRISMFVGNPPRELLIFTGVAIPEWGSKSTLDRETVIITLPGTTTPFFQSAASVGLASIMNTDSDFTFAADETSVVIGANGQLELHVDIAVQGEESVLSRINYHVEVLSEPLTPKISGTIRWDERWGEPTASALAGFESVFRVTAGMMVIDSSGGGPLGSSHWEDRASTTTNARPIRAKGFWAVPYVIDNVPLNQILTVIPTLNAAGFARAPDNPGPPTFNPPPRVVQLTPAAPMVTGIDYEMTFGAGSGG